MSQFIHHPDGYFVIDLALIPEDVFMDAFPDYPELPDGAFMRGVLPDGRVYIQDEQGQKGCPTCTPAMSAAWIAAKDALRAERNTRYPYAFSDIDEPDAEPAETETVFRMKKWPPVPNPKEQFDPRKRRDAQREDSDPGASPGVRGDARPGLTLAQVRSREVAAEAAARREAVMPRKDRERVHRQYARLGRGNKPTDKAALDAIEAQWATYEAVEDAEEAIIASFDGMTDEQVTAVDIPNHPLWP